MRRASLCKCVYIYIIYVCICIYLDHIRVYMYTHTYVFSYIIHISQSEMVVIIPCVNYKTEPETVALLLAGGRTVISNCGRKVKSKIP